MGGLRAMGETFLSIQAQDFIEEACSRDFPSPLPRFLSIQAQDFIEDYERGFLKSKRFHS